MRGIFVGALLQQKGDIKIMIALIRFYQRFISAIIPGKCRYYPSCSEYAIIEFEKENFFIAFFKTLKRILTCNQLFRGGIDYPIISFMFQKCYIKKNKKIKIKYFLVPISKNKAKVIKKWK